MRAVILLGLLAACSPEIGRNTYFCGPERFCPPDLACDEPTHLCEVPALADPFQCPKDSETFEPDDTLATAQDVGSSMCGAGLVGAQLGCIADGVDVDNLGFEYNGACSGSDPHIHVTVRFPVAFVPLTVRLLGPDGAEVAVGQPCTPPGDQTGTDELCVEARPPSGHYVVQIGSADHGDCGGGCHYNQYTVDIVTPLS